MVNDPVPDVDGSKVPPVTLDHEKVPPDGLSPDKVSGEEYAQRKSTGKVNVTLGSALTAIDNVAAEEFPQLLFAVIVILPLVELAVVVIELVVDDPLQPLGNVHVYDVAPDTAADE